MLVSIGGGFLVLFAHTMRVYRKSASVYDIYGEYKFTEVPNQSLCMSPQEDIMVFYNPKNKALNWCANW